MPIKTLHVLLAAMALSLFMPSSALRAATLVLGGRIDGAYEIAQERSFTVPPGGLDKLAFRFAQVSAFKGRTMEQGLSRRGISYHPKPETVVTETDGYGNAFTTVTWKNLKENASVKESFDVSLHITLDDIKDSSPFPLPVGMIPSDEKRYLKSTRLVESDDEEIKRLARSLTAGAKTEQAAAMGILNWVVDNIRYRTPVPDYGALWTLKARTGNCQNFSHLSIALLRASGIPARIVGGISLGKPWRVPLKEGALLQSIGQGGHAWIEVWYPGIGWVPYDAQQSHIFVGPRHIKQTAGLDADDINDSWRASPVLPAFKEDITAGYTADRVDVSLKETRPEPLNYILTSSTASVAKHGPPAAGPPKAEPEKAEFGNTDFPALVDIYSSGRGGTGQKTFDKETAEYVTGGHAFAQAFYLKRAMTIEAVSLAMHRFGGRYASLWVDIVADDKGRPGMDGIRSMPLMLDTISYHPGYRWFDFLFSSDSAALRPGKYWIVLRHSKDAVVNWFYTPGNPYGMPDDARSTEKGIDWSNIMNYDFNFRVKGDFAQN